MISSGIPHTKANVSEKSGSQPPSKSSSGNVLKSGGESGLPSPTCKLKAWNVLRWFRSKRKEVHPATPTATLARIHSQHTASSDTLYTEVESARSLVACTPALRSPPRVYNGPIDHLTVTYRAPHEVMRQVGQILENMGVEIRVEGNYKYRCIRYKRKRSAAGLGLKDGNGNWGSESLANDNMTTASKGVDKPLPTLPSAPTFSIGGMLRGLLKRERPITPNPVEPVYGSPEEDAGGEVRFSVELTRIARLEDTYILNIRKLKGSLRSFKFLYDTLREAFQSCR
ncbi:hypothetical protein JAAARDRAFT_40288 [Jaapia argillacea MUCL 33604]|uniref:KA1 domain-containing protein n=1 Tax=Jaapia argillacea MUCL 33604 TaxID=933084 RepID=A0A067PMA7_9AGAM|nr:hypothetical protein JAAARDRAFT_40288 [Jaapia argillacea MUCL 33604]